MVSPLSPRSAKWGAGLIVDVLALSLASYLILVYYYAPTRRLLSEYASSSYKTLWQASPCMG